MDFFYFGHFNKYLRNKLGQSFFFKYGPFELRQSIRRDLRRSHASALGTTHFHVNIGCHINPIGPTTTFGIQNESRHFEWHDSNMSRATPFGMTYHLLLFYN
jgi:hypothetical protein